MITTRPENPTEHFPAEVTKYIVNIQHADHIAIGDDAQAIENKRPDESS